MLADLITSIIALISNAGTAICDELDQPLSTPAREAMTGLMRCLSGVACATVATPPHLVEQAVAYNMSFNEEDAGWTP